MLIKDKNCSVCVFDYFQGTDLPDSSLTPKPLAHSTDCDKLFPDADIHDLQRVLVRCRGTGRWSGLFPVLLAKSPSSGHQ